jgi:3-phenylpropionate/cinnamic acid dioxygenase small subunit
MDFLIDEAAMLDEDRLTDWLAVIAPDIFYWMPVRQTVARRSGAGFDASMSYFFETFAALKMRVERIMKFDNTHSEDPPSRTRRLITNVKLYETAQQHELAVEASLLVTRNRGDTPGFQLLAARRHDLVRRTPEGWRLSQRVILLDETVLATPNLGIFL